MRMYTYPVDEKHSTVLGYGALSRYGKIFWASLHWRNAWKDNGVHLFNPSGGEYLHVRVKPLSERCVYRVRCRHAIGNRWRGGTVKDVKVKKRSGNWEWIVTVSVFVMFCGCSHITIAPKPVVAHSIAFSGNVANGGVVECDSNGCVVTASWMDHYRKLEKANKNYIGADKDIRQEGVNWRISYEVLNSYLRMRQAERGA